MDFPGGSLTNIHVIDGFSTIYWRIYTEEPGITSQTAEAPANGHTILKHLSRLKELEVRLRGTGCFVSCYPRRLGLWIFSATPDFDSLASLSLNEGRDEPNKLLVGSVTLKVSASGSVLSRELLRNLSAEPQTAGVAPSGARPQATGNQPRRLDGYGSAAAIYASFTTAVTGAICLQLVRLQGAIPLGSRTLFTAVEREGYESPGIANDSPTSTPSLTSPQVQLTPNGKLIVSFQTIAQPGLSRLHGPKNHPGEIPNVQPGIDVWLSPNGVIARLSSVNTNTQGGIAANNSNTSTSGREASSSVLTAKRLQWKQSVLEWLRRFGLPAGPHEEEVWVEVEVWEPFYARLAGDIWRQNEENSSPLPLKRILWPARYCFKRTKSILLGSSYESHDACRLADNPLDLAEDWHLTGKFAHSEANFMTPSALQEQLLKDPETSPSKNDIPDAIESLSRIAQYPDMQNANLVYPTPPDGSTGVPSDALADYTDPLLSQQDGKPRPHEDALSKEQARSDPNLTMDFGPSAGLTVGSGLYDVNGEDDLFGEMNEKDFGAKGITDADFSFFDDPGFEGMGEKHVQDNINNTPNTTGANMDEAADQPGTENLMAEDDAMALIEPANEPQGGVEDQTTDLPQEELPDAHTPSPCEENSQPISPPLSPVEVKKILFPGSDENDEQSAVKREGKQSHYTPVAFKQNVGDWNQKYGTEGRFWFSNKGANAALESVDRSTSHIPTIGLPHRGGRNNSSTKPPDKPTPVSSGKQQHSRYVSDSSTTSSDDDSDEVTSLEDRSPTTLMARKRKRARSESSSPTAQSPVKTPAENPQVALTTKIEDSIFLGNFLSAFSDWSLMGYFSISQNQLPAIISSKDEQIQVAQLLVDQITQSSLDHKIDGQVGLSGLETEVFPLRHLLEDTAFPGEVDRLDLKGYISLQDDVSSPTTSGSSTPRPPPQRKDTSKEAISKLSTPHLRIRRGKDYLEALPPTISFWETFDLEPSWGPKNVSAYCIHPHIAAEAADTFLDRIGLLYSSCNLGGHTRGDRSTVFERGLGSWSTEWSGVSGYVSTMQSLWTLCEELGTSLSNGPPSDENFVIYVINPFTHAAALADICAAFWQLFQKYISGTDKQQSGQADELVLQIIPMGFVKSPESIVVPSQSEYLSLALEVYSRCPPKDIGPDLLYCAPPVLLTEPAPKNIDFKFTSEQLSSPLHDGKSLHIACSKSLDQRWITVAWSDNTGSIQRTMSYCLRSRSSNVGRSIADVRNGIWSATQTIMDRIQARWRVIIVNTEPVDQDDVETWTNLTEQRNKTNRIPLELVILHVNATPDLFLEPPPLPIPMSVFNAQTSSSPIATPAAASPDLTFSATTPTSGGGNAPISASTPEGPPEAESEYTLSDVNSESWAVILSHRLNNSPHLMDYRPALASGYLLRRKGPTDGDGLFATTVNLIYAQRPSSSPSASHEALLKDILAMYHDLGMLARVRGTQCVQRNTLPWHIATAIRAQELLSYVF